MPSLPFEDENLPLFTVGQVSAMLEIQQAFLRRLDDFGVVVPSRSSGRQRRYTRNEITVIQYVVRLADEGMTLPSIRHALRETRQRLEAEPPGRPGSLRCLDEPEFAKDQPGSFSLRKEWPSGPSGPSGGRPHLITSSVTR